MGIPIPTRLWWDDHQGRGVLSHKGVQVELGPTEKPHIAGLPERVTLIDFMCRRGEYRVLADRAHEMDKREVETVLAVLEKAATAAAAAARAALGIKE
jgi:hypothetical protein